jgi:hypothetical protein
MLVLRAIYQCLSTVGGTEEDIADVLEELVRYEREVAFGPDAVTWVAQSLAYLSQIDRPLARLEAFFSEREAQ